MKDSATKSATSQICKPLAASLKNDTARMNDRNKHKVTGQMNHQTAGPKSKRFCTFIFSHRTFFKNNFSQPHKWHIWFCPTHKPTLRKTKRAIFCQRTTEYHKFENY